MATEERAIAPLASAGNKEDTPVQASTKYYHAVEELAEDQSWGPRQQPQQVSTTVKSLLKSVCPCTRHAAFPQYSPIIYRDTDLVLEKFTLWLGFLAFLFSTISMALALALVDRLSQSSTMEAAFGNATPYVPALLSDQGTPVGDMPSAPNCAQSAVEFDQEVGLVPLGSFILNMNHGLIYWPDNGLEKTAEVLTGLFTLLGSLATIPLAIVLPIAWARRRGQRCLCVSPERRNSAAAALPDDNEPSDGAGESRAILGASKPKERCKDAFNISVGLLTGAVAILVAAHVLSLVGIGRVQKDPLQRISVNCPASSIYNIAFKDGDHADVSCYIGKADQSDSGRDDCPIICQSLSEPDHPEYTFGPVALVDMVQFRVNCIDPLEAALKGAIKPLAVGVYVLTPFAMLLCVLHLGYQGYRLVLRLRNTRK